MDGKIYVYCMKDHILRLPGSVKLHVAKGAQWIDEAVYNAYKNTGLFKLATPSETDDETPSDADDDAQVDPGKDDEGESKENDSEASDEVDGDGQPNPPADAKVDPPDAVEKEVLLKTIDVINRKKELIKFANGLEIELEIDTLKTMKANLIKSLGL